MERKNPFLYLDPRPLPESGLSPLQVCLVRGEAVESRHNVHGMVVNSSGEILHSWGDPNLTFYPRSSIKLIQAIPWVMTNASEMWSLGVEELAIACGSHQGEPFHTAVVEAWLKRLNLSEQDLECGAHYPYSEESARELSKQGKHPSQLHNNCSGKHAGILTTCRVHSWPTLGYASYDHPAQEKIREVLGLFLELDMRQRPWGVDGCGIPTYLTPLKNLALAMAKQADPSSLDSQIQKAVVALNKAIAAKSQFIGGTDSFCSEVVPETEGRVFAKVGAEGVYGAWIPSARIGIALKCEDGRGKATEVALAAVLRELGYPLSFFSPLVRRWAGEVVGQYICG